MDTITELANLNPVALDSGQVFSGRPSGKEIMGYAKPSAYTPAIDPDYIFHESSRDVIVWLRKPTDPLYVFGPVGAGKTSLIKQLAARLNYPVFEIAGHGRLEFADLAGHLTVQNGSMAFEYGPLALAMRYGGILLFNEIDLTSPEVAAGLNSVLDGSPLCIAENGGELITPHPLFRFVATANTNGGGDETGLYQGTQRQNLAFADRFILCEIGYPSSDIEQRLLQQRFPSLPKKLCRTMVDYANEVRKLFMGESSTDNISNTIEVTFSTRSLLRWADLTVRFQPLAHQGIQPVTYALDRALAFRASRETRAMLHELAQRHFPQQFTPDENAVTSYNGLIHGDEAVTLIRQRLGSEKDYLKPHRICLSKTYITPEGEERTKLWTAESNKSGLILSWGREDQPQQQKYFPSVECEKLNPITDMMTRAEKKIREGYSLINNKSFL